ncbi:MAG: hypothetical protein IK114_03320 [Fibrobacter sp.]|nr:hypothetical protein [Fibrobacter sp.]
MRFTIIGLFFAVAMANATSVWERSPWDNSPMKSKQGSAPQAVRENQATEEIKGDPNTFVDTRDHQLYKTVTVYGMTWLAENLNYESGQSSCYNNNPHCKNNGRLYTWHYAQRACPPGTRLPTVEDWEKALESSNFEKTLTMTGYRFFNGGFYDFGNTGAYWAAEEKEDYAGYAYFFKYKFGSWKKEAFYKEQANSIRCIVEGSKTSGSHTWGDQ